MIVSYIIINQYLLLNVNVRLQRKFDIRYQKNQCLYKCSWFVAKMSVRNNSGDSRKDKTDLLELILQRNTKTIQQQEHCRILGKPRH